MNTFLYSLELVYKWIESALSHRSFFVKVRSNLEIIFRIKVIYFNCKTCFLHDWTKKDFEL